MLAISEAKAISSHLRETIRTAIVAVIAEQIYQSQAGKMGLEQSVRAARQIWELSATQTCDSQAKAE